MHPRRDPGCYHEGPGFLRELAGEGPAKGLLLFDQAWDGNPHEAASATEVATRERLSGLQGRADVVVIEPELEAWVWSDSPEVDRCLGWAGRQPGLREWLRQNGLWDETAVKPSDPKMAYEKALREARKRKSNMIFAELASSVALRRCTDRAFIRLKDILQRWFPAE